MNCCTVLCAIFKKISTLDIRFEAAPSVGARSAVPRLGSGSIKLMRFLAAPVPPHCSYVTVTLLYWASNGNDVTVAFCGNDAHLCS
jgi:hypothetical protein